MHRKAATWRLGVREAALTGHVVAYSEYYATSAKFAGSIPDEVTGFFNLTNPSSRTMALGLTQPLTEISTRNHPRSKGWTERNAENLTATCELIVYKIWKPQCLATTSYRESITFSCL
jgi:hypothetical protein